MRAGSKVRSRQGLVGSRWDEGNCRWDQVEELVGLKWDQGWTSVGLGGIK